MAFLKVVLAITTVAVLTAAAVTATVLLTQAVIGFGLLWLYF